MDAAAFIARRPTTEQAERTNAQPFLLELCDLLRMDRTPPVRGGGGPYRFERSVTHHADDADTTRRIDLYKRGCFILEAKRGALLLQDVGCVGPGVAGKEGVAAGKAYRCHSSGLRRLHAAMMGP